MCTVKGLDYLAVGPKHKHLISLEGTMKSEPGHVNWNVGTDLGVPCQSLSWQCRLLHKQWRVVGKPGSLLGRWGGPFPQSFYFQRGRLQQLDLPGTVRNKRKKVFLPNNDLKENNLTKRIFKQWSRKWKSVDGQDFNIKNPKDKEKGEILKGASTT